ncbi:MAG: ABC transporter permease [Pseudolysinimonas sp.]|uniref:ABC transporter permease n=1 Tax=Pseudolysinimonas sp. TaxID=2680009 RepID=UPI003C7272C6
MSLKKSPAEQGHDESAVRQPPRELERGPWKGMGRRLTTALGSSGGILLAAIALTIFFSLTQPSFLTSENASGILRTTTALLIAALGMTFVMIAGAFDLSVGSMSALAGVILVMALSAGLPAPLAILATLVACSLIALIANGLPIGFLAFNFFVVTLATLSIFRGAALLISNGQSADTSSWPLVQYLGDGKLGPVPVPIAVVVVVYVLGFAVLKWSRFGRMVFAVGGNPEAAWLAGIDVRRVRAGVFALSGGLAALAGVLLVGRLTSSQPVTGGIGLELAAASAVLLGGTSFAGGSGSVWGTAVGCIFIGVLQNGLTLSGVPTFWQAVATGAILFLALTFERFRGRLARGLKA